MIISRKDAKSQRQKCTDIDREKYNAKRNKSLSYGDSWQNYKIGLLLHIIFNVE